MIDSSFSKHQDGLAPDIVKIDRKITFNFEKIYLQKVLAI